MPSIRDVAKKAGVSVTTVSRVLNDSNSVTEDTRRKIKRVMTELGYRPNPSARALRNNRTNLIALVIPELVNPYFSTIALGVQDVARQAKLQLILCNSGASDGAELDYLELLPHKQVDGLIVATPSLNPNRESEKRLEQLGRKAYPIVSLGRKVDRKKLDFDSITTDTAVGTREAMLHLLENGHTRIAYFGAPAGVATTRLDTYKAMLAARGLFVEDALIFATDLTLESGYKLAKTLLALRNRPTAILAVNDMVAIGAILAFQEQGVEIPKEMSVIGFDDIPLASIMRPHLTTVAQPKYDLGRLAAERLIGRLQGVITDFECISLSTRLVVRESTRHTNVNFHE